MSSSKRWTSTSGTELPGRSPLPPPHSRQPPTARPWTPPPTSLAPGRSAATLHLGAPPRRERRRPRSRARRCSPHELRPPAPSIVVTEQHRRRRCRGRAPDEDGAFDPAAAAVPAEAAGAGLELEETETNHGKQNLDFIHSHSQGMRICRHAIRMSAAARRRSRNDVDLQDWTCGDICLGLYQPDNHGSPAQEKGWY
ncbi:hypothetical protein SETIT_3G081000v2 [Setaria italica]|uniref:Uncharacterized protein n=1 Tax=Setaria italica TaxID=4555 RepID=A0A368QCR2_SETIT|nr:hypothetical protein SETIT_3G081000v2 [Setaria italica]